MPRWLGGGRPLVGFVLVAASVLSACGGTATVEAGGGGGGAEAGVLAAVLEPNDALVDDFGSGWEEVDRWWTEGSMTRWDTGCGGFDRLGDIFNHGTPQTVVWAGGGGRMFQRTDDFGWDAGAFADAVAQVPDACPSVTIGAVTVSVSAVDPVELGDAAARITDDDPDGRVVAIALDAWPDPSLETDISTPEFIPDRPTWMVVATRHNVVSQLVYGPGDSSGTERLGALVEAQVDALLDSPVQASGPFERPAGPPAVEARTVSDAELFVDPFTCRNDGGITLDGIAWRLTEPVPFEWRERNPILGDLAMDGTIAVFTAHPGPPGIEDEGSTDVDGPPVPLDGFTVELTTGDTTAECVGWERERPRAPLTSVGRLDCGDGLVEQMRVPDEGQTPDELARESVAGIIDSDTLTVEAGDPLQWWGLDADGRVVVGVFLGDAPGADYQIFVC